MNPSRSRAYRARGCCAGQVNRELPREVNDVCRRGASERGSRHCVRGVRGEFRGAGRVAALRSRARRRRAATSRSANRDSSNRSRRVDDLVAVSTARSVGGCNLAWRCAFDSLSVSSACSMTDSTRAHRGVPWLSPGRSDSYTAKVAVLAQCAMGARPGAMRHESSAARRQEPVSMASCTNRGACPRRSGSWRFVRQHDQRYGSYRGALDGLDHAGLGGRAVEAHTAATAPATSACGSARRCSVGTGRFGRAAVTASAAGLSLR